MDNLNKYKVAADFEIIHVEKEISAANEQEAKDKMRDVLRADYQDAESFEIKAELV